MSFIRSTGSHLFLRTAVTTGALWLAGCGTATEGSSALTRSSNPDFVKNGQYSLATCRSNDNSEAGGHTTLLMRATVKDNKLAQLGAPLLEFAPGLDAQFKGASSFVDSRGDDVVEIETVLGIMFDHEDNLRTIDGIQLNLSRGTVNIRYVVRNKTTGEEHIDSIQAEGCAFSNLRLLKLQIAKI